MQQWPSLQDLLVYVNTPPSSSKTCIYDHTSGPYGSGASTICDRVMQGWGMHHLNVDRLLRNEMDSGSSDSALLMKYMQENRVAPGYLKVRVIKRWIEATKHDRLVISTFPTNMDDWRAWQGECASLVHTAAVIHIECPRSLISRRLFSHGTKFAEIAGILRQYEEDVLPLVEKFRNEGQILVNVNGSGPVDDIYEEICIALKLRNISSKGSWHRTPGNLTPAGRLSPKR